MIGQLLIAQGLLSAESLQQALAEQHRRHAAGQRIRLGELLVEMGFITAEQLAAALATRERAAAR